MPFNVPDDQKPTFNKEVKSSLELLAGGIDQTLGQWEMLQPETLVEEYQKPIQTQVVERLTPLEEEVYRPIQAGAPAAEGEVISAEPIRQDSVSLQPEQERVAPIVREYQTPMREDIMSVSPYQQAVADATSAQVDSLRNEAGELPKSAVEVFSKPFNENSIKALGMVDGDGNPTEKGELFYNLSEAGMFDESGVLTKKGQAYLTPISEMSKPEWFNQQGSKDTFDILWNDGVIRASSTFAENVGSVVDLVKETVFGGAQLTKVQALGLAHSSRTWSGQQKTYDPKGKELEAELATSDLAVSETLYKNAINLFNATNVAVANDRKFIEESILSPIIGAVGRITGSEQLSKYALDAEDPNIKSTEDALVTARYKQWATDQRMADMESGEIAETILGLEGSLKRAEDAKAQLGQDKFNKLYKGVGAFTSITGDPLNMVPAKLAFNMARGAPLANRLQLTAQKTMGRVAQMELAIAKGETAVQSSVAALAKSDPTISLAQRMAVDFAERAKQQPALLEKSARASQIANRTINEANQIRSALPAITSKLESLVAKRNSLATRIPESYAQKMLQTMEIGRQARSMPAKAIGATLERVGNALSKTDDAVTNFLKDRGFDQMYTAAVGAAGVAGMAGSPIIGAVAAGAAALKTGKVLSSYGKLFRYVGKEMENVRGQIPFWKRVASHTAPNSLGRGIAHSFNMLDLGGVTSDVLRRTGRGIAAAAPTDLMFEYLSDGADMRPETLYQAAAESLVIGGSFAAAGGAFMGTKKRMRELSIGDELNFKRDLVDPRQKALFEAIPSGTRSAIATYSIANPTLNYQFKDSGASQYDPNTNTATINVKSTNPIKALVAHETLHHTIIKNNMESGISALFLGDMKENTVGGLFRSRDGKLDPNFEAFKDAYYNRLGVAEMSNAERDAIYPLDKVAVEYFIEKHSDQYSAMAESGELGAIASSGVARRKLGSILETILPRVPVLRDLHFKSGGMIDANGSWVTGNGILDAEGVKTDPITNKMFRDMNRRSAGLATGQFEPLISDKADSGASIILNPSDSIDSELLHPLVKTDENGKPILENGRAVALDKATELERALAGLTVNEVLRRKRSENYVPEKGEAYIDDNNQFQSGWLPDDVVSEMFAKNRFNPEQKRIIREMNRLVKKGTGDRVVMINFPATTRNKSGKAVYKPQGATLRDTVPVAILTSKDGNLLFGLMSVTKLQENIQKRSQSARGKRLYSGNVDLILRDTQAMMDFHKNGVDSIEYFSEKYGAVEADQRKKFINTMFGLLNQKEQAVLNPMLLEDGVKSKDNVYRTYRADRVSKAVPMSPQDYPAMPFSYKATSQVLLPEQARQMPEGQAKPSYLPEPMKKPYGPNDPLPKFESTVVKGETNLKGFKWDKATNVVYDIGGNKTMSFSYDPAYLIKPKFGNPEKLLKGKPVIMLEADKARATGGDMGGVNFPNLRSNQVTVTGPDGIDYRVKWANMTSTFVSGSKNRMQSHGAKYALIQLMDDFALKSNKRTARTLDQAMRDAALTSDQNNMIAMAMNYGIIVGKKGKLTSTATALKRALSDATTAEKEIINKKIKSTLAERDALNPSPDEMEVFKSISNVKTAMSNLATGRWKQSTVDNAFANFQALKGTDAFRNILSRIQSPYVYDNVGNTFTDRGAAVGSITSVKMGDFNVEKIMKDSSDFKEAKNLDIVSAVELSQNPDFFALYFGKDPLQEAAMSANERSARDKMLADNDFQIHESYDWAMIGPAKGGDFIFDKPVKPEEIFKKYRAVHEKASVKDGSEETVAGAMRKSAEYKLTAYGDTVKMTGEEKPTKAKKTK